MRRNLIVCIDGTWNTKKEESESFSHSTNVARVSELLINDDERQLVFYLPGVGTHGFIDHMIGGIYGSGVSARIKDAYLFLCKNYQEGDRIALFGFSRGAFAVRSVVGVIAIAGLLHTNHLDQLDRAVAVYRNPLKRWAKDYVSFREVYSRYATIDFIGVWDTVARYGPLLAPIRRILEPLMKRRFGLFDHNVSECVHYAYHALALDEVRGAFRPHRWSVDLSPFGQVVEEIWFSGSHSDVGGGNRNALAAEPSLEWMVMRAAQAGLLFHSIPKAPEESHLVPLDDSRSGLWKFLPFARRIVEEGDVLHESVFRRMEASSYSPKARGLSPNN